MPREISRAATGRGLWAVVTGASGGKGEAFAHQLAGQGLSLVPMARLRPLLLALAAELECAHGMQYRRGLSMTKFMEHSGRVGQVRGGADGVAPAGWVCVSEMWLRPERYVSARGAVVLPLRAVSLPVQRPHRHDLRRHQGKLSSVRLRACEHLTA